MGKVYKISKGNHYSWHIPKLCYGKTSMHVKFKLMDGCWFDIYKKDDYAINKLCGWSMGMHHTNSIRCGWTPSEEPGVVDLFFYVYRDKQRVEQFFTSVEIGMEYDLKMSIANDLLSFTIRNGDITTTNSIYYKTPNSDIGAILFPYIGGELSARIDTKIELEFC